VVVPAHEEQESIGACLRSIALAAGHPHLAHVAVHVVVVLDDCTDDTADRAGVTFRHGRLDRLVVHSRNVGQARAAGIDRALGLTGGLELDRLWLATTDADTVVPPDWLARQLAWRDRGADAVAGTVRVTDWAEQPTSVRRRFLVRQRQLGTGAGHGHVHGANLGLAADSYCQSGGVPPVALAEDHALWAALRASGRHPVAAGDLAVTTSARRESRAPGGFSDLLRDLGT